MTDTPKHDTSPALQRLLEAARSYIPVSEGPSLRRDLLRAAIEEVELEERVAAEGIPAVSGVDPALELERHIGPGDCGCVDIDQCWARLGLEGSCARAVLAELRQLREERLRFIKANVEVGLLNVDLQGQLAEVRAQLEVADADLRHIVGRAAQDDIPAPIGERVDHALQAVQLGMKAAPGVRPVRTAPSYGPGRCEVCGWTLAKSIDEGCIPGNCSYRPDDHSPEGRRIAERRKALAEASR
jgi:hypothetical protein